MLHRDAHQTPRAARAAVPALTRLGAIALAAAAAVLMWAAPASATPDYPFAIDAALGVTCPRPNSRCLICHTTARGGQRTAEQPFAQSLKPYGLVRGEEGGVLMTALMQLPDDTDSDGDGVADKDELEGCGNPSGPELGFGPEYGCDGAHLAPVGGAARSVPVVLLSLAIAAVFVRPRRR